MVVRSLLKELWISYNSISTLDGLQPCSKLTTLFISNNQIKELFASPTDSLKAETRFGEYRQVAGPAKRAA
eukprot:2364775-Amphidinium_carterae.1